MFIIMTIEEAERLVIEHLGNLPEWYKRDFAFVTVDQRWKFNSRDMKNHVLVGKTDEGKVSVQVSVGTYSPDKS